MATKMKYTFPVKFAADAFGEGRDTLAALLREITGSDKPRILIVADANVVQRTEGLGTRIGAFVSAFGFELACKPVILGGSEKIKDDALASVLEVATAALEAKLGADGCILALGGGSVLDVAGYAAAQVRGGVKLVRLPTTPAAMIDAAFSDYAAVNHAGVKDALRVACAPAAVLIDTTFGSTVLDGVWRAGYSEAVRLAVAFDAKFFAKLAARAADYRSRNTAALEETVAAAVGLRLKKGDPAFGVWSALRLEAMSNYKLPHGYAMALGIAIDASYSVAKGLLGAEDREAIVRLLTACGAMDGALHSHHLLGQAGAILRGLDAWALAHGAPAIVIPVGIGKTACEEIPDRDTMKTALNMVK